MKTKGKETEKKKTKRREKKRREKGYARNRTQDLQHTEPKSLPIGHVEHTPGFVETFEPY